MISTRSIAALGSFILLFGLSSCDQGLHIYTNGIPVPISEIPYIRDSAIVIGPYDKITIDPRAKLIGATRIESPVTNNFFDYYSMKLLAMREAQRIGANIVQVVLFEKPGQPKHFNACINVNLYAASYTVLSEFKKEIALEKEAHRRSLENVCKVHLEFGSGYYRFKHVDVLFNDQVMCQLSGNNNGLPKHDSITLTFKKPGSLSLTPLAKATNEQKISIELGKEYYLLITDYYGLVIFQVSKDHFENDLTGIP